MDETLSLPTEKAAEIALRTQQLLAYETGVSNVVDPLGGSWFIEDLTDKIEEKANEIFKEIDNHGGVINGIEDGYFQREISRSASSYQKKVDNNERIVVGVNRFKNKHERVEIPTLEIDSKSEIDQVKKIKKFKEQRNHSIVDRYIQEIKSCCSNGRNLVPVVVEAAKNKLTLGEIVDAMKSEFGEWTESSVF
jgi:methylmalonyl-CoA mutase N-terminal domain/subunit